MPARRSTPKAKKPDAGPHDRPDGQGTPLRETRPKANPAVAVKKSAARVKRGGAAAFAQTDDAPLTPTEEAFVPQYLSNGQNGTAAWVHTHPGTPPDRAAVYAYRLVRKRQVTERIRAERARLAKKHEVTRDQLLANFLEIARADPNELVQMRAVACQACWGGAGKGSGHWTEPDPDCEECGGEGIAVLKIADTRKLSTEGRALYAGVHQTKDGIKVLMHDKVAAMIAAGRIIGAFERDNAQKAKPVAEALREFFGGVHQFAGGLPIAAPAKPEAPPAPANPLVKG